ncbi:imidazole glycerol phosphate synthase subunit HisH [Microbacterium soli]|uniref:Imidazole glycerol phosphate synthase subunit HisH n=1 Tax=Microbacterium soli TaxID=446075 RepID=A0ABP7MSV7_9MICO
MSVGVLEYGLGNFGSVMNMLKRLDADPCIVRTPEDVAQSERLLLPGVGAFDRGMLLLETAGLDVAIREFAAGGRPVLGICLGMQLLLDSSEEGASAGLGLVPGRCMRFSEGRGLRVPHMGWNRVTAKSQDPLFATVPEDNRFYFVHSYHAVPADPSHTLATTNYGDDFVSMVRRDNVIGAQFHPEKSHLFGLEMLRSFSTL